MGEYEKTYIEEAFETNWVAPLGPNVDAFESEIAQYLGIEGAVALSSGTAALHLAMRFLGIEAGDRVFCSSLTFIASASPIIYLGAEPVFIDSDMKSWNMDPTLLEKALRDSAAKNRLPKGIVVTHLYGQSADLTAILALCESYEIPLIEDSAESLGSTYKSRQTGTYGKFGIFSFNGNKIITTSGGGMLVSNDLEALEKARFWATQARDPAPHYEHSEIGYNYRLSNILAGIGRGQLRVLPERIEKRRAIFERYRAELDIPGFHFMPEAQHCRSNRWLTTLRIDSQVAGVTSEQLLQALKAENIEARPVWKPMHLQPVFKECEFHSHSDDKSISEEIFANGICLPSGSNLSEEDQTRIIHCIQNAIPIR